MLLICEPLSEPQGWRMIPKRMEVIRKEGSEDVSCFSSTYSDFVCPTNCCKIFFQETVWFQRVGQITSGTFSVRLHRPLAFAWVHSDITANDKV